MALRGHRRHPFANRSEVVGGPGGGIARPVFRPQVVADVRELQVLELGVVRGDGHELPAPAEHGAEAQGDRLLAVHEGAERAAAAVAEPAEVAQLLGAAGGLRVPRLLKLPGADLLRRGRQRGRQGLGRRRGRARREVEGDDYDEIPVIFGSGYWIDEEGEKLEG